MFKLFKSPPKEEAILALDIGTAFVKASVFTIEERQTTTGEVIGKRAHAPLLSAASLASRMAPAVPRLPPMHNSRP